MWGVDILRMENIKNLIEDDDVFDKEFFNVRSKDENEGFQKKNRLFRFDCMVSLLASAECTIVQDIFRTLSQFPITFPLIMPELNESNKFKMMLPLLIGPVIK